MKSFFSTPASFPAAALVVLGTLIAVFGFLAIASGGLPVLALGLAALFAGGVLQIWSQRQS